MKSNLIVIVSTGIILILLVSLGYVWQSKSSEIKDLNVDIERLNTEITSLNADVQSNDKVMALVLGSVGSGMHSYVSSGQNYYKYFNDPDSLDLSPQLKAFVMKECPSQMYTVSNGLVRTYVFETGVGELGVVVDEVTDSVLCSYIHDVVLDSYAKP
ncbi:MAG: hypothetical protein Q7R96_01005 [Nanoarchaeota archaeon]|nr:hypothetical protein [Nanoarchaeota archaeon]